MEHLNQEPQSIGEILDQLLPEIDFRVQSAPLFQDIFEGMRAYQQVRDQGESTADFVERSSHLLMKSIPLRQEKAILHLESVIGAGHDGVVLKAQLENLETDIVTPVAAKLSRPFRKIRNYIESSEDTCEEIREAASQQYAALTELAVHSRLDERNCSYIPILLSASVLESFDATEDRITLCVMEYIEGKSFDELAIEIQEGLADFRVLRPALDGMIRAVRQMNESGVCVWDVNPTNILIRTDDHVFDDSQVAFIDFSHSYISGALDFYRKHEFEWYPEIRENNAKNKQDMNQRAIRALGESWFTVSKDIVRARQDRGHQAKLLESLAASMRDGKQPSLNMISSFLDLIFDANN
ncbi:hypothetical protein EBR25_08710 [bacterium]|nr:hypothetical protein [bacterium]